MQDTKKFARYISEFAPELRDLYLTLMPFDDVIHTVHAGPQMDHEKRDPYFCLDFSIWENGEIVLLKQWEVTEKYVVLKTMDGDLPSSMRQLWDFLRQLPRDPYAFTNQHTFK